MKFKIGKTYVGKNLPNFIVAEMSGNHNGKFNRMKKMIFVAKRAGSFNNKIIISNFTGIGPRSYISCSTEDYLADDISNPTIDKKFRKNIIFSDIFIGENVLVGIGCVIIPRNNKKIDIGNNVSIAANTIISKTIKNNCVVYNPYIFKNNSLKIKKSINSQKIKKKLTK